MLAKDLFRRSNSCCSSERRMDRLLISLEQSMHCDAGAAAIPDLITTNINTKQARNRFILMR